MTAITCSAGVKFVGSVRSLASWSKVARMMIQALRDEGITVSVEETAGDRWDPAMHPGGDDSPVARPAAVKLTFEAPTSYESVFATRHALNVGLLVWEADRWPTEWISAAGRYLDLALVPSSWCRQTLVESGFPSDRVRILPHGFDPAVYTSPQRAEADQDRALRVLYVGTPARRKGLDLLIAAIRRAFVPGDRVQVIVKSCLYHDADRRRYLLTDWQHAIHELARSGYAIEIITADLSELAMGDLYRSVDLIVQPFRGEGFCLPLLEAAACGVPFIATEFGGPLEFLTERFGWFLQPGRLVDAVPLLAYGGSDLNGAVMPEIEVSQLADLLRRAFRDTDGRKMRARAAPGQVANLTWSRVARKFIETVDEFLSDSTKMPA